MMICTVLTIGLHVGTYHFDRTRDFQEVNPGVYAKCDSWVAGGYLNSEKTVSIHVGKVFKIGSVDVEVGAVTGYKQADVLPLVVPSMKFGAHRFSLLLPLEKRGGGIHYSFEF